MQVIDSSKDGHCIIYALKNCLQASGFTPVPLKSEILTLIKEEFCNNFDTYYYKFIDIDTDSEKELDDYLKFEHFSNNTSDLIINILTNVFETTIVLLRDDADSQSFVMKEKLHYIYPAKLNVSKRVVYFRKTGEHYDALVSIDSSNSSHVRSDGITSHSNLDATYECPIRKQNIQL